MKLNYPKKQRGAIVVLVAIALPVLLLIMGLALDFGHVFVNKTRLQNALDATALSAAIAINRDITHNIANANIAGRATFDQFKAASGNDELSGLNSADLVFDYSRTLEPWGAFNPASDKFAFVRVTSTNMLQVTPVLIRILEQFSDDMPVPAIATAGPVGNNCSLAPFVMCADMPSDIENIEPLDTDCSDNACYGYAIGEIRSLVIACNGNTADCPENSLESGNYNLLDLDGLQGGKDIRDALCGQAGDPGYRNTCTNGNILNTKPGYTWGNVRQGFDCRFDSDTQTTEYSSAPAYTQYKTSEAGNNRRVIAVPLGDCRGLQNGNSDIPKVGTGCVFLTERAIQQGSEKKIMVEFIGSCLQNGTWSPDNPVLNGPYKIVLFKSPGSNDS
ncbi:MAG: TadE/TadG family type IV pilus assembly protein [Methylobacter sp.]